MWPFILPDYIGFMKKALVLLRGYPLIKRLDLEVQQIHGTSPDIDLPPIRKYAHVVIIIIIYAMICDDIKSAVYHMFQSHA